MMSILSNQFEASPWLGFGLGRFNFKLSFCIRMSHWRHTMVDGTEFWITCKRLKLLRKADRLQLIQNSVPSTIVWRQFDIRISWWKLWMCHFHQFVEPVDISTPILCSCAVLYNFKNCLIPRSRWSGSFLWKLKGKKKECSTSYDFNPLCFI